MRQNYSPVFSTGHVQLDTALGTNGIPGGSIIEIYGKDSSGKTTLCLEMIANAQKNKLNCLYIDADHALTPEYAIRLGIDKDKLLIMEPKNTEQVGNVITNMIDSGTIDLIVIDSLDSLISKSENNYSTKSANQETTYRILAYTFRKNLRKIKLTNAVLIYTTRTKLQFSKVYYRLSKNPYRLALKLNTTHQIDILLPSINQPRQKKSTMLRITKNKFIQSFIPTSVEIKYNK